jgi:hypothetical protein
LGSLVAEDAALASNETLVVELLKIRAGVVKDLKRRRVLLSMPVPPPIAAGLFRKLSKKTRAVLEEEKVTWPHPSQHVWEHWTETYAYEGLMGKVRKLFGRKKNPDKDRGSATEGKRKPK